MSKYRPQGTRIRTSSPSEAVVVEHLARHGWEVLKSGWPDFIAVRGEQVRFIEVKNNHQRDFKPHQKRVARIIWKLTGIQVELLRPALVEKW